MTIEEKIAQYEMHIEDMLCSIEERLEELNGKKDLTEFEQGRQLAFIEMMEIMKTRHRMILEVLED